MTAIGLPASPTVGLLRPAPRLRGTLDLPSDKSIAHRALIFAALAQGESQVVMREPGADVLSTVGALRALGVGVDERPGSGGAVAWVVGGLGRGGRIGRLAGGSADCGNSGTTMRLLAGALASGAAAARLTGDASLSRRPMERIAAPLRAMGADVATTDGHAPLTVAGRRPLRALEHTLPIASAQVLGAICLAALAAGGVTAIRLPGPARDHTERLLRAMGAAAVRQPDGEGTVTTIEGPAGLRPLSLRVAGDFSSAAAWIVAATVHRDAEVRLAGVGLNPTRTALIDVLRRMGADIEVAHTTHDGTELAGDIVVRSAPRLQGRTVSGAEVAALVDELPLLAVAMAAADGMSEVRGAAELRVKESDRIGAMAAALRAIGADVEELPGGWRIRRGRPRAASVATHGDHRIAIALAVAAWSGVAESVELDDPTCVAISYPSFWGHAASLGVGK